MNTPLDSRQIRAFCVLARTGSFTQTARELHLTQSGISHSMKALESDVGCRLLDRVGKKIVLTQAGEQLLHHTKKILFEMESAREAIGHLGKWGRGRLRLGASPSFASAQRMRIRRRGRRHRQKGSLSCPYRLQPRLPHWSWGISNPAPKI